MEKYSEENKMNDDNEFDDINIKTNSIQIDYYYHT